MEIWQLTVVNLCTGVSQDSMGFKLVGFWLHAILWIIFSFCPLETSPCSSCVEAVKEKERKKQLRVRFQKGCQGVRLIHSGCVHWGTPKFRKVFWLKSIIAQRIFVGSKTWDRPNWDMHSLDNFWVLMWEVGDISTHKYLILGFPNGWNVAKKRLDVRRLQQESNRSDCLKGLNWRLLQIWNA